MVNVSKARATVAGPEQAAISAEITAATLVEAEAVTSAEVVEVGILAVDQVETSKPANADHRLLR